MTTLILRNLTPVENRRLPQSYHSYVAFDQDTRAKVADIKYAYRPKNAGGSAWQATMPADDRPGCAGVLVYSKTLKQLCEIVRHVHLREGQAPSHWR